jgi:hypothetical protein
MLHPLNEAFKHFRKVAMKKLVLVWEVLLVLSLLSGSAMAQISFCKDFLESGNPGGWSGSLKTWDEHVSSCPGAQTEIDIWLNDVPEPLLTAGFWIAYDSPGIDIEDVLIYDGSDLPGPWNPGFTIKVPEPDGPGTYLISVGGWLTPPYIPIIPDSEDDIIIGKILVRSISYPGQYSMTLSTFPGLDTVVGESSTVYDSQMIPNTITLVEYSCPLCCTYISTHDQTTIYPGGIIDFYVFTSGEFCTIPLDLVFSDDCVQGDVDPITGIFTADATLAFEECQVCVLDNINTGSCNDPFCMPPADCCSDVTILGCLEESDGDGVCNEEDNCPNQPNGPRAGTCITGYPGLSCSTPGYNISECGADGYCSMAQEDSYPSGGNNCGDACECEGNFDDDQDLDGSDAATFKLDFGRSIFIDPCSNGNSCNGDFDCDVDVDGTDAAKFKEDFGRSPFNNPCPSCPTGPWCMYEEVG